MKKLVDIFLRPGYCSRCQAAGAGQTKGQKIMDKTAIHTTKCQAAALICAVENMRDWVLSEPGLNAADFAEMTTGTLLKEWADGYLADGTMTCTC